MLVTWDNVDDVVAKISRENTPGLDTETYHNGHMFALQIACEEDVYYFNFLDYGDGTPYLEKHEVCKRLAPVFEDTSKVWFIQNAKFDLHRLLWCGAYIRGRVHDLMIAERLIYNQYMLYSLAAQSKRRGLAKDDTVEKYVKEHKLSEYVSIPGKKTREKISHYELVPFSIMYQYGAHDAVLHRTIGLDQIQNIPHWGLYLEECANTKTCLKMENRGVCVDTDYAQKGREHEETKVEQAEKKLTEIGGRPFKNGPKWLQTVFDEQSIPYRINPKTGNPVFDKSALETIDHPIAEWIRERRRAEQYISTYYSTFIYKNKGGVIHPDMKQGGTDTGRFSYANPNLQNVPKEEDSKAGDIEVRKCIVPREGYTLVPIDFKQQEFRLMLDYAKERKLIQKVMAGADLHQATADMVGIQRTFAKRLNFALLYGMGVDKMAVELGVSRREAEMMKLEYFGRLPNVEDLIYRVIGTAKRRGNVKSCAGRILQFPSKEFAYKAPNHLIQGGCGDIAKIAMNRCDEYIEENNLPINMLIQVHDEIIFEVRNDAFEHMYRLKDIMENVYTPRNGMDMECSIEYSHTSWGKQDLKEVV